MKKRSIYPFFCAIIGILLLNSCGSIPTQPSVPPELPTVINPTEPEPTVITSTNTPVPTRTITPTIEPTDTYSVSCFDQEYAKEKSYNFWCGQNYGILISHDFSWGAFGYMNDNGSMIVTNNHGVQWQFSPADFMVGEGKEVNSFLQPEAWTEDNKYLYFSVSVSWDGGGPCFWDFGPAGVFKLNVNTGEVETILPVHESIGDYWNNLSISPDGKYLVYNNHEFTILQNLFNGDTQTIQLDENEYQGDFTWNPNGDRLIFVSCHATPDRIKATRSEVNVYSMETRRTRTLFSEDFAEIDLITENSTEDVVMSIYNNQDSNSREISLNLIDYKLSTPTPTQSPTETPKPEVSHFCFDTKNYSEAEISDFCSLDRGNLFSSDSSWGAFHLDNGGRSGLQIGTREEIKWTLIPTDFLVNEDKDKDSYLWPQAWSPDNRYFYFTSNISRDGVGDCLFDLGSQGIYRLDTTNGKVKSVVPLLSSAEDSWYDVSISPDGRYLIYDREKVITFTDLSTGKSTETPLDEVTSAGNFEWSSDGKSLSYTRCTYTKDGGFVQSEEVPFPIPGQ